MEVLVYCPFKEDEQSQDGWDKSTVEYVNKNNSKIKEYIKRIAKSKCSKSLHPSELDDILSEVNMYMFKHNDWDYEKAVSKNGTGFVSIEGYVNACVKYCVMSYLTTQYKHSKCNISDRITEDDKELSIFDAISDTKALGDFENVLYDLRQICEASWCYRYKYGVDIYLLLFIRLLTLDDKTNEKYKNMLDILGISKKDMFNIQQSIKNDDMISNITKAILNTGVQESINILKQYVYSADKIMNVVHK